MGSRSPSRTAAIPDSSFLRSIVRKDRLESGPARRSIPSTQPFSDMSRNSTLFGALGPELRTICPGSLLDQLGRFFPNHGRSTQCRLKDVEAFDRHPAVPDGDQLKNMRLIRQSLEETDAKFTAFAMKIGHRFAGTIDVE